MSVDNRSPQGDRPRGCLPVAQQCHEFPPAPAILRQQLSCLSGIDAVPPSSAPTPLKAGRRLRSGAFPAVEPAASAVPHRWRPTNSAAARLRPAPRGVTRVPWRITVFQPAASWFMGFIADRHHSSPSPPVSPSRQSLDRRPRRSRVPPPRAAGRLCLSISPSSRLAR